MRAGGTKEDFVGGRKSLHRQKSNAILVTLLNRSENALERPCL